MKREIIADAGKAEPTDGEGEGLVGYQRFAWNLTHPSHRPAPTDADIAEGRDLFIQRLNQPGKRNRDE
ncbi:MAG: hypothetical protein JXP73_10250 [Deltaproteobacteria bacterium]|nr:hypothetical protein [Deltaproteobacteria bacterium]